MASSSAPACPAYKLYAPYTNARDYLYAELKIAEFLEWENGTDPSKRGYNPCITVRREPDGVRIPAYFMEMRCPVPPRADGRKFAIGNHEDHKDVRKWLGPTDNTNLPYLRNCPLWEGDIYLEKMRAKHTDEELEDLFVSFWQRDKLTWSEMEAWEKLPQMQERLYEAEEKVAALEAEVAALKKASALEAEGAAFRKAAAAAATAQEKPEILSQSAMQMVIAITLIARACPEAGFQEIHDMWRRHAEADAAEVAQEKAANADRGALRALVGQWMSAGMPDRKCLCACLEPDCPTMEKVYVKGRGFVGRWDVEQEGHEEHEQQEEGPAAGGGASAPPAPAATPPAVEPKKTWAQIAGKAKKPA